MTTNAQHIEQNLTAPAAPVAVTAPATPAASAAPATVTAPAAPAALLLHACCGPCSLEPTRELRQQGYEPVIFYANSNIHPADEYRHRLDTLRTWAESESIRVEEGLYEPGVWEHTAGRIGDAALDQVARDRANGRIDGQADGKTDEQAGNQVNGQTDDQIDGLSRQRAAVLSVDPDQRKARCRACYRLRFEETAAFAKAHGFDAIGTTLSVSPYQYTEVIREELERAAHAVNLQAVFQDYRPFYEEATRRSRELGMYRQNFCGCRISDLEAQAEREERKAERKAKKAAEKAAHAQENAATEAERQEKKQQRRDYNNKQARKRAVLKALREQGDSDAHQ